jgi:hypothetical protein
MDFRELFLAQHGRTHTAEVAAPDLSVQDLILKDVTSAQIRLRPRPGFNSLAWFFWHMTRAEDIGVNAVIAGRSQIFDQGDWAQQLKVQRRDVGTGMTKSEADLFNEQIDVPALLAYRTAVGRQTQEMIRRLDPQVLDEVIDETLIQRVRDQGAFGLQAEWVSERWRGKQKAFTLAWSVLGHTYLSLGECYVLRGLLGLATI